MRSVIVGNGEVGSALARILVDVDVIDRGGSVVDIDILHICFPFSDEFISEVVRYQHQGNPRYTIIHSTVPPGTSRSCGALHSPVVGIHPFLDKSLATFTKFIGGEKASEVADYFRRAGIKIYIFNEPETTELMKILDTNFYKMCIEYTQDVKRYCEKYDVPFEAWTLWTENYNQGYQKLGYPEYTRPNLVPIMKEIGGHCLTANSKMLD